MNRRFDQWLQAHSQAQLPQGGTYDKLDRSKSTAFQTKSNKRKRKKKKGKRKKSKIENRKQKKESKLSKL